MKKTGIFWIVLLLLIFVIPVGAAESETTISGEKNFVSREELEVRHHTCTWTSWTTTIPATCTTDGEEVCLCEDENCTKSKTKTIPAAHNYGEWEIAIAAECLIVGKEERHCLNCDWVAENLISATGHKDFDRDDKCDNCEIALKEESPDVTEQTEFNVYAPSDNRETALHKELPTVAVIAISVGVSVLVCSGAFGGYLLVKKRKEHCNC